MSYQNKQTKDKVIEGELILSLLEFLEFSKDTKDFLLDKNQDFYLSVANEVISLIDKTEKKNWIYPGNGNKYYPSKLLRENLDLCFKTYNLKIIKTMISKLEFYKETNVLKTSQRVNQPDFSRFPNKDKEEALTLWLLTFSTKHYNNEIYKIIESIGGESDSSLLMIIKKDIEEKIRKKNFPIGHNDNWRDTFYKIKKSKNKTDIINLISFILQSSEEDAKNFCKSCLRQNFGLGLFFILSHNPKISNFFIDCYKKRFGESGYGAYPFVSYLYNKVKSSHGLTEIIQKKNNILLNINNHDIQTRIIFE